MLRNSNDYIFKTFVFSVCYSTHLNFKKKNKLVCSSSNSNTINNSHSSNSNCFTQNIYYNEINSNNFESIQKNIEEIKVIIEQENKDQEKDNKIRFYLKVYTNFKNKFKTKRNIKKMNRLMYNMKISLRNYLNFYQYYFYNYSIGSDKDNANQENLLNINLDSLINIIKQISHLKTNLSCKYDRQIIKYLFNEIEEIILRIEAYIVIINKHNKIHKVLTEENINFIINQAKHRLSDINETEYKKYLSKRILLNYYFNDINYFYNDTLLEINTCNFDDFANYDKISYTNEYENDLIFINGLNVNKLNNIIELIYTNILTLKIV